MMKLLSFRFVCLLLLATPVASRSFADEPADLPKIQLVLFTPADVDPPPGYVERMTEIIDYTENFFGYWMVTQNYPPARTSLFSRDADRKAEVLLVRGTKKVDTGEYDRPSLVNEVYQIAIPKYSIPRHLHVWWVHVYLGPDREYTDYRGSGNAADGGSSVARYSTMPGHIDTNVAMLDGFHQQYHLKGIIHELGHALGLPHLGPRPNDRRGNTLMGPNQFEWNKVVKRPEPRVFLSEASAAMLWKHPLMSGSTQQRNQRPQIEVAQAKWAFDPKRGFIVVSGKLQSDVTAHSAIVVDRSSRAPTEYWQQSYVARVEADGTFSVEVTDPILAAGELQVVFCFDNGAVSGTTGKLGLDSAIKQSYEFRDRAIYFP